VEAVLQISEEGFDFGEVERGIDRESGRSASLADLGRQINRSSGLGYSEAKWRGIWKDNPELRFRARRKLSKELREPARSVVEIEGATKGAVISDIQVPYQDMEAVRLAIEVLGWWDPDVVVIAGDGLDCTMLSDFDQNPSRNFTLQDEAEEMQDKVLGPLRAKLKRSRIVYIPGNHEKRIRKQMYKNPWLYEMTAMRLENLLDLGRWKVEFAEYAVKFGEDCEVSHGTFTAPVAGYAAKKELEHRAYMFSTITGHIHRSGTISVPKPGGDRVIGRENPCLCQLNPEWTSHFPRWSQGLTLLKTKSGYTPWISSVDFASDYTTCADGKWF